MPRPMNKKRMVAKNVNVKFKTPRIKKKIERLPEREKHGALIREWDPCYSSDFSSHEDKAFSVEEEKISNSECNTQQNGQFSLKIKIFPSWNYSENLPLTSHF